MAEEDGTNGGEGGEEVKASSGSVPPYIPFKTFLNLVLGMEEGAPPQLDRSYLSKQAGGMHQPIIAAFKFFDLIGSQNEVKPALEALAASGDALPQRIGDLVRTHYSWAHLGSLNATPQMLDEAFRQHGGLTGSTLRKQVTFYLHASRYAGLPLSRYYKVPRGVGQTSSVSSTPGRSRKRPTRRQEAKGQSAEEIVKLTPESDLRRRYIEALIKKVEDADAPDADLLDRIEGLFKT